MTLGRACAVHSVACGSVLVLRTSQPPTPGERIRLGGIKGVMASGVLQAFAIFDESRIAAYELKGETWGVECLQLPVCRR